jgi:hypothetical protein
MQSYDFLPPYAWPEQADLLSASLYTHDGLYVPLKPAKPLLIFFSWRPQPTLASDAACVLALRTESGETIAETQTSMAVRADTQGLLNLFCQLELPSALLGQPYQLAVCIDSLLGERVWVNLPFLPQTDLAV